MADDRIGFTSLRDVEVLGANFFAQSKGTPRQPAQRLPLVGGARGVLCEQGASIHCGRSPGHHNVAHHDGSLLWDVPLHLDTWRAPTSTLGESSHRMESCYCLLEHRTAT